MDRERLAPLVSRILILLNDLRAQDCDRCKDYGGISCTLYPGSQKRVVTFFPNTELTLPPTKYKCPVLTAGFYEKKEALKEELRLLRDELDKITPNR